MSLSNISKRIFYGFDARERGLALLASVGNQMFYGLRHTDSMHATLLQARLERTRGAIMQQTASSTRNEKKTHGR